MTKVFLKEVEFFQKRELCTIKLSRGEGDYCILSTAKEKEKDVEFLVLEYVDELIYDDEVEYSIRKTVTLDYFELENLINNRDKNGFEKTVTTV